VIALATAAVSASGAVRRFASAPPLTLRQVNGEDPSSTTLCLVGSAAGPLAGDQLTIELDVAEDARACLIATGAMMAQGDGDMPARLLTRVSVAAGATLDVEPGPLIVCAGGSVDVRIEIELDPTASLRWRELLILGRFNEPAGAVRLSWHVDSGDQPLLRQTIDLTDRERTAWPGMLQGKRVMLSELAVQPGTIHRTVVHSPTAVIQRLNENASLTSVLADDAAAAVRVLDALR
jgi:urease accessory protein